MNRSSYGWNVLLFVLTFFTLTFQDDIFRLPYLNFATISEIFRIRTPYSFSLLGILFCHEMGHYLAARYYGIKATLPYFLPVPFSPVGTMGAVIRIKEPIRNKIQLFDIGIWGPAMSLVLSIPCIVIGLYNSQLVSLAERTAILQAHPGLMDIHFGDSLFTYMLSQKILGPFDSSLFTVEYNPLAFAGWVGLLITALNLLPFGQLDGGHVVYSLAGEGYRKWIYYLFSAFLFLSLWNYSWILWGLLIYYFIRVEHPFVPDASYPIGKFRKIFGWGMLLSFLLIFPISPITVVSSSGAKNSLGEDLWNILLEVFSK